MQLLKERSLDIIKEAINIRLGVMTFYEYCLKTPSEKTIDFDEAGRAIFCI